MILNITYGANVANAPPEFKTAVATVAQFFETTFTNPVTVNIQVDFARLGHDLIGQSSYTNLNFFNNDPDDDFGDWDKRARATISFLAFSSSGVVNPVTATDLRVMDVLGWDLPSVVVDVSGHGSGSRIYSKYLGLQIKACELGLLP